MYKFLTPLIKRARSLRVKDEHLAVIESMVRALDQLDDDTSIMRLELMILTSTGRWLDTWGEWFGVPRNSGEEDQQYSKRIIETTVRPKNTKPAIENAIDSTLGCEGTTVFEPHTQVAKFNISTFSGKDRYLDGKYWRPAVIDVEIPCEITDEIRELVNSIKAAGVSVYYTASNVLDDSETAIDKWRFSDKFIPLSDHMLIIEPNVVRHITGAVFSSTSSKQRSRSGKQTIWGTYVVIEYDMYSEIGFNRIYGMSKVLLPSDFKDKIPEYNDIVHKQGEVTYERYHKRPATRSHHAVFSGMYGFSGAPGNDWVDEPYMLDSELYVTMRPDFDSVKTSYALIIDLQQAKISGPEEQILFVSEYEIELGIGNQKRELTFEDPYIWLDFLYAVRAGNTELAEEILSEAVNPLLSEYEYSSTITTAQLEEYGINIQGSVEIEITP